MKSLVVLLVGVLAFSGCASQSDALDVGPDDEDPAPGAGEKETSPPSGKPSEPGEPGEPGRPGTSQRPDPGSELRVVFEEVVLATWEGGVESIIVPEEAVGVWMEVEYLDGAYQDAGFTLGGCDHVSPETGIGIKVAGFGVGAFGTTSRGVQYPCGDLDGEQQLSWNVEAGAVRAHVRVLAEFQGS